MSRHSSVCRDRRSELTDRGVRRRAHRRRADRAATGRGAIVLRRRLRPVSRRDRGVRDRRATNAFDGPGARDRHVHRPRRFHRAHGSVGDRRWTELLAAHDAAVRAELERWRGREIKSMGDGMLATFDGPGRALRCAAAIRDSVRSLGLEIRIGLPHRRDRTTRRRHRRHRSRDRQTRRSNRCRREESSSRGQSLTWSPGSGIEFTDYGVHELKGVRDGWQLYQAT